MGAEALQVQLCSRLLFSSAWRRLLRSRVVFLVCDRFLTLFALGSHGFDLAEGLHFDHYLLTILLHKRCCDWLDNFRVCRLEEGRLLEGHHGRLDDRFCLLNWPLFLLLILLLRLLLALTLLALLLTSLRFIVISCRHFFCFLLLWCNSDWILLNASCLTLYSYHILNLLSLKLFL